MIKNNNLSLLVLLLVNVLFFSCKKEEQPHLDLNFQVRKFTGAFSCSWTPTNISTFERIYILHAPFPLSENERIKDVRSGWKTIIHSQDNNKCVISLPTEDDIPIYFQLFIDIGHRIIKSDQLVFGDETMEVIDSETTYGINYPDKNIYYFGKNGSITSYDYLNKVARKKNRGGANLRTRVSAFSNNTFGEELYLVFGRDMFIFDANTLENKGTFTSLKQISSVAANDLGFIVITVKGNAAPIQVLSRDSLKVLNTFTSFNPIGDHLGVVSLSKDENLFMEIGEDWLRLLEIDEAGQVIGQSHMENPITTSSITSGLMVLSPSGDYIIHTSEGNIYDRSMNAIKKLLPVNGFKYYSFLFDDDENYLYTITYDNSNFSYSVDKFSIPDFELVEQKNYENNRPIGLFSRNGEIQVLFISSFFDVTFIKPLDF